VFTISTVELEALLAGFFYPFFRVLALASSAPVFSHESVPRPVRIGLCILVTLLVTPLAPRTAPVPPFSAAGVVLVAEQLVIGLAIGLSMQIAFAAVTLAGDLIGLQMGLSFASFIDPQNSEQAPLIGSFLSIVLMLVFLALNGHLLLIGTVIESFQAFPVSVDALRMVDVLELVHRASDLFLFGLQMALPVITAMLLTNVTLGMLARTSPQLNLLAVGFAVTLIAGLLMIAAMLPLFGPGFETMIARGLAMFRS
jgi:flagellar biosynthetic protein FliR